MLVPTIAQCLAAAMATIAFGTGSLPISLVALGLYSVFCVASYGTIFSEFLSNAPIAVRGSAMAVLLIAQNLMGYGLGPGFTGFLSDYFMQLGYGSPLRYALIGMASFYLLAALLFAASGRLLYGRAATLVPQ
jgi:hypothetical protein